MRPKSLILLSLALGCGLVAALGINQMMAKQKPAENTNGDLTEIYVAQRDVSMNDALKEDAFKKELWPKDKVPPGAITKLKNLEGRRVRGKLFAGEPILEAKLLASGETGASNTDHIPPGYRVVSVRVDAVSATGNLIRPGDRVDVLVHINQNVGGIHEPTTKIFLEDVRIFAVNDVIGRDPADGDAKITAQTISLLVKPNEVEMVTLASSMGSIRLSLRGPEDEGKANTDGAQMDELFAGSVGRKRSDEENNNADGQTNPLQGPLSQFLANMQNQRREPIAPRSADEPFRMVMIVGSEIEELELQENGMFSVRNQSEQEVPADTVAPPVLNFPGTSEDGENNANQGREEAEEGNA